MGDDAGQFDRTENHPVVRILQCLNLCFARIYHQVTVRTPCSLPRHGPAILVCNHISGLDPLLIQSVCPRLIRWMMAKEYYEHEARCEWSSTVGAIPVERGGRDMAATRAAFRALERRVCAGRLPRGANRDHAGTAAVPERHRLLAGKTGVPVYPAYLEGTQRGKEMVPAYLHRNRSTLSFGRPFTLSRGHRPGQDGRRHRPGAGVGGSATADGTRTPATT